MAAGGGVASHGTEVKISSPSSPQTQHRIRAMEYRRLGASGFKVPVLSFGTGTFGGKGKLFAAWGATDTAEARRLLDICLDAGVSMFDTADIYSAGESERILGEAMKGKRDRSHRLHQGDVPFRRGAQQRRLLAPASAGDGRCAAEAPADRLHRSLPVARLRRHDAARGSAVDPRYARARRQDPLRRRVELLRLAHRQSARRRRQVRLPALRRQPDLLLAHRSRVRMGADAARPRGRPRRGGVEPARLGTSHRQDPPRHRHSRPTAACTGRPRPVRRSRTSTCSR